MFLYFTDDGVQMLLFCASVSGDRTMKGSGNAARSLWNAVLSSQQPLSLISASFFFAFLYLLDSSTSYCQVLVLFQEKNESTGVSCKQRMSKVQARKKPISITVDIYWL